ncbi:energy transducer TonB [Hymenobacter nivis]|uniref:TonB C-terminal domain-containing protein n=1 Tax=Hymenobacter nivis TaxID=1850093 RepID=A0A502GKQ9_9BACT|nr:energy transducer TonB [Hymenobacter nivis]TPG62391.1 hypothetical protein EAH73_19550 [Hymenobacter nivis]
MIVSLLLRWLGWGWMILGALAAAGQGLPGEEPLPLIYTEAAQMPALPTGPGYREAVQAAVQQRLVYRPKAGAPPPKATDGALVTFVVGATGRVGRVQVLTALGPDFELAVRAAVAKLPRFVPARQEGEAVGVYYTLGVGALGPYQFGAKALDGLRPPPGWPIGERGAWASPRLPSGESIEAALERRLVLPPAGSLGANPGRSQVEVIFTVDVTGHVVDALVGPGSGLPYNRAALQTLARLPVFRPGTYEDKPVAVWLRRTIVFPRPEELEQARRDAPPAGAPVPEVVPDDTTRVYTYVEQMPRLPRESGAVELVQLIQRNAVLPAEVRAGRVEGPVGVSFVVGRNGRVRAAQITRGLSPAADAAVLAAVGQLPRFVPGRQNGQPVAVSLALQVPLLGPGHVFGANDVAVAYAPKFPAPGLGAYLRQNLRLPPVVTKENLNGRVGVSFVVGVDGRVREAQVTQHLCASCDEEALRLVRAMPAWAPARNADGHAIAVRTYADVALPPPAAPAAPEVEEDKVYTYVERMPELPGGGGLGAIEAAIRERAVRPAAACAGRVFVSFIVRPDGTVTDAKIVRGVGGDCEAALLAATRQLPRFLPGRQNGRLVSVSFTVSVGF